MNSSADFSKELSIKSVICPSCGADIEYRNFMECPNVVIKRYEQLVDVLKTRYGDVKINNGDVFDGEVLLTIIKDMEHTFSKSIQE